MKSLSQALEIIAQELATTIQTISTLTHLESIRVAFLGRKGKIADLMEQLKHLPVEEKKIVGPLLNQFKTEAQTQLDALEVKFKQEKSLQQNIREKNFDVSAYKHN